MRTDRCDRFRLLLPASCSRLATPAGRTPQGSSTPERRIVAAVDARTDAFVPLLAETVDVQSATENLAGVRAVGDIYAREYRALGFETRWVDLPAGDASAAATSSRRTPGATERPACC